VLKLGNGLPDVVAVAKLDEKASDLGHGTGEIHPDVSRL
jgi:hypothetical protein